MTVSELRSPVVADEPMRPPLLPEHPRRMGPVTRALVLRTVAVIAAVQVLGAVLVVVGGRWRAAGLSLAFPGGGFLYTAAPLAFALTWVALTVALVLWWGVSLHVGIPAVWLASSAGAALWADCSWVANHWCELLPMDPLLQLQWLQVDSPLLEQRAAGIDAVFAAILTNLPPDLGS